VAHSEAYICFSSHVQRPENFCALSVHLEDARCAQAKGSASCISVGTQVHGLLFTGKETPEIASSTEL
jgi:hypothetical protein